MPRLSESSIPKISKQSQLTKEQIIEKLQGYRKLRTKTDIKKLNFGNHVRYFTVSNEPGKDTTYAFRIGGFVKSMKGIDKGFIVLSSTPDPKGKSWSVQLKTSILYQKIPTEKDDNEPPKRKYTKKVNKTPNKVGDNNTSIAATASSLPPPGGKSATNDVDTMPRDELKKKAFKIITDKDKELKKSLVAMNAKDRKIAELEAKLSDLTEINTINEDTINDKKKKKTSAKKKSNNIPYYRRKNYGFYKKKSSSQN